MIFKKAIFIAVVFMAFLVTASRAQTAKQWETLNSSDGVASSRMLVDAWERARTKAVAHYRATNDNARADLIQNLQPNAKELIGRVALAASVKPDVLVENVMKGYIIDISNRLMSRRKPSK